MAKRACGVALWLALCVAAAAQTLTVPIARRTPARRVAGAASSLQSGVPLVNYQTVEYTGEIYVGTPLQPMRMIFDTGSADLWFFSDFLVADKRQSFIRLYRHNSSSTYQVVDQPSSAKPTWRIEYGTGRCEGFFSRDTVTVGGLEAHNQTLVEVTSYDELPLMDSEPFDGIWGLAWSAAESTRRRYSTVLDSLKAQGKIASLQFSFYLTKEEGAQGSLFFIGDPVTEYAPKGLHYANVVDLSGMWRVQMDGLAVGSTLFGDWCSGAYVCTALIDTGTSFLQISGDVYDDFMRKVTSSGSCSLGDDLSTCTDLASLPRIDVIINGRTFPLHPSDYTIPYRSKFVLAISRGSSPSPNAPNVRDFILGDVLIKSYYTVFDMEAKRIGFANPASLPSVTPTVIAVVVTTTVCVISAALLTVFVRRRRAAAFELAYGRPLEQDPLYGLR